MLPCHVNTAVRWMMLMLTRAIKCMVLSNLYCYSPAKRLEPWFPYTLLSLLRACYQVLIMLSCDINSMLVHSAHTAALICVSYQCLFALVFAVAIAVAATRPT
jgi:hypothetical protein